jgi:hypothetical protein
MSRKPMGTRGSVKQSGSVLRTVGHCRDLRTLDVLLPPGPGSALPESSPRSCHLVTHRFRPRSLPPCDVQPAARGDRMLHRVGGLCGAIVGLRTRTGLKEKPK